MNLVLFVFLRGFSGRVGWGWWERWFYLLVILVMELSLRGSVGKNGKIVFN